MTKNVNNFYKLRINNSLSFKLKRAECNGGVRAFGFTLKYGAKFELCFSSSNFIELLSYLLWALHTYVIKFWILNRLKLDRAF